MDSGIESTENSNGSTTEANNTDNHNSCQHVPFPSGSRLEIHFPIRPLSEEIDESFKSPSTTFPPMISFTTPEDFLIENEAFKNFSTRLYDLDMRGQRYALLPYQSICRRYSRPVSRTSPAYLRYKKRRMEKRMRSSVAVNDKCTVEDLLKDGVSPDTSDDKKRSPLHIAASKGFKDIVKLLLDYKADPNQKDSFGNTPLHLAACISNVEIVTLLLKAGTDVKLLDNHGQSPLSLAKSRLKHLQKNYCSSLTEDLKNQVSQVVNMIQAYLEVAGNREEAELLKSFTSQLSLSDTGQGVQNELQSLLNSLQDLTIGKSKEA